MKIMKLRLNHAAIGAILRGEGVRNEVLKEAQRIAEIVSSDSAVQRHGEIAVNAWTYTTDRAMGAVTMAGPTGLGVEAKYGPLSRAVGGY